MAKPGAWESAGGAGNMFLFYALEGLVATDGVVQLLHLVFTPAVVAFLLPLADQFCTMNGA